MAPLQSLLDRALEPEDDPSMPTQWLTVTQTSNRLNLHRSTIYRHLHAGTFPCRSMRIGRSWRIESEDVDSLRSTLQHLLADSDPATTAAVLSVLVEE